MNYLAHFHLAEQLSLELDDTDNGLLIGALLGDYVKGILRGNYPASWERGIWLHRRIDALTDSHPLTRQCLDVLPKGYRRFGGIMLDVCFDHCLSSDWAKYDSRDLSEFNQHCYRALVSADLHFPRAAQRQIRFLAEHDILSLVKEWSNVEIMLERIGRRMKVDNPLAECGPVIRDYLPVFAESFSELYLPLRDQLAKELQT